MLFVNQETSIHKQLLAPVSHEFIIAHAFDIPPYEMLGLRRTHRNPDTDVGFQLLYVLRKTSHTVSPTTQLRNSGVSHHRAKNNSADQNHQIDGMDVARSPRRE